MVKDKFLDTYMNYCIVVKGKLEDIQQFKEYVSDAITDSNLLVVYQCLDPRKLKVKAVDDIE